MSTDSHGEASEPTYWCFISYRHNDNREVGREWASWLHQAIETYEVPEGLVDQVNERGDTIPPRLFPVFRDEEELPADAELSTRINRALRESRFLVVVCSPAAVESRFVNDEIRTFKTFGKDDRILAMIIRGEPNAAKVLGKQGLDIATRQECFPLSLRQRYDASGQILDETAEPIAADFRLENGSEGWTTPEAHRQELVKQIVPTAEIAARVDTYSQRSEHMKLKIIAGIIGVPLGTLTERDKAHQLARAHQKAKALRRWLVVMSVLGLLILVAGAMALIQWRTAEAQRRKAVTAREQAEELIGFMVGDLQSKLAPIGGLSLANSVNQRVAAYYRSQGQQGQTPLTLRRRAMFYDNLGNLQAAQGALNEALKSYNSALEIRQTLALQEPDKDDWQSDLCLSYVKVGDVLKTQGDLVYALKSYQDSRTICERFVAGSFPQREWQWSLSISFERIGDVQEAQGAPDAAENSHLAGLDLRRRLTEADPENTVWQRGLGLSYSRVGDLQTKHKFSADAISSYQKSLTVFQKLAAQNPSDSQCEHSVFVLCWSLASLLEREKPDEAGAYWQEADLVLQGIEKQGRSLSLEDHARWQEIRKKLQP